MKLKICDMEAEKYYLNLPNISAEIGDEEDNQCFNGLGLFI